MIALIMAGGIGSRFWPLSRRKHPKQFLPIVSNVSMIRLTVNRLLKSTSIDDIFVVTAQEQSGLVMEHLPDLPPENIIAEPFGMNTAPCIGLSLIRLLEKYPESETMLVAAADHLITRQDEFFKCLKNAQIPVEQNMLVTFGIKPDYPATSYGYIETDSQIGEHVFQVKRFQEKPNRETAEKYLKSGNFLWNSGMFFWKLKTIKDAFQELQPEIWNILKAIRKTWHKNGYNADISDLYKKMPKIPVDIGIMEKSDKIAVVPADIGWSDVGGWKALSDLSPADENGNCIRNTSALIINSNNNYIYSNKLVSLLGVNDLVVVETEDVLLIMDKNRSEEVKKIVDLIREQGREEFL